MNHRILLAAAIAAAFAAPAFADVTVYGSLRTGIEYSVVSGPGAFNQTRLVDQSSRMGFKGTDKLDNGMTVSWKTEETIRVGGGSNGTWGARDQSISLDTNGAGTFTAGKQIDSFGDWGNAVGDNAFFNSEDSYLYQTRFTGRQSSALKYVSPTFAGFTANVSYIFGGKSDSLDYNNFGYAGLISYDGGGMFSGSIGMIQINDANGPLYYVDSLSVVHSATSQYTTNRAYVATGSAKLNEAWSLGAHYELYKSDDRSWKRQQYGLGVAYAAGKWGGSAWLLRADKSRYDGVKHDDAADQLNLNVHYDLSKNTKAGIAYTYLKKGSESNNDADNNLLTGTGLGAAGQKVHAVAFSIRTNF